MGYRKLTVVVSDDQAEMLAQMAVEQGESMSAFLRGRIFARENMTEEFAALQSTLLAAIGEGLRHHQQSPQQAAAEASASAPVTGPAAGLVPMLAEVLLLMRAMAAPAKIQSVHGDIKRLGLEPFKS